MREVKMPRNVETKLGNFEVRQGNNPHRIIVKYNEECDNPSSINMFIKDLGKFETLVDGLNKITTSMGLSENREFNIKHIDFQTIRDFSLNNATHRYEVIINSIETEREADRKELPEETIGNTILNIEKLHSLKISLELWNEIKNPPNSPH